MNYAYLRVSMGKQDIDNQRHTILDYCQKKSIVVDEFIEDVVSSKKAWKKRKIGFLIKKLQAGDKIIVCEVTRLGRSGLENAEICELVLKAHAQVHYCKEGLVFGVDGQSEIERVMLETQIMMLGQFGKLERSFISARTKEGLVNAKSKGKKLGRPFGAVIVRKLDRKAYAIIDSLKRGLPKTAICKLIGEQEDGIIKPVPVITLTSWLKHWQINHHSPYNEKFFPSLEERKVQIAHLDEKLKEINVFVKEAESKKSDKKRLEVV